MSWEDIDSGLAPNSEFPDKEEVATRMIEQHGREQAAQWAEHYAYNNYESGTDGYAYWRSVAEVIRGRSLREGVEGNPIPPAPKDSQKIKAWARRTFPVGTPVIFEGEWIALGDWTIPDGVKGEVVQQHPSDVRINLFAPMPGDSRFAGIERLLAPGDRVEDLDVYVSYYAAAEGAIRPLVDTWGSAPQPMGRHSLPRSQRSPLRPNARARPLKGAAMSTRFGKTVEDPDSVDGTEGHHLDAAMDRYETFHDKAPIRIAELSHDLPKQWVAVGDALAVMYRTDKWKKDGSDIDYKHLHDKRDETPYEFRKGVRLYEPAKESKKSKVRGRRTSRPRREKVQKLPVSVPKALTMLGYCLGFFVRRYDDGKIYEVNPRGCWLFSSPSGNMLAVYSPDQQPDGSSGFLAVMAGGKLRVLKDGIDG